MISFRRSAKPFALSITCAALALTVSGCAFDFPSNYHPKRVELVTENYSQQYPTAALAGAQIDAIAADFRRYGNSEMEIIVTYDPRSKTNTAMKANDALARITDDLRRQGVPAVKGSLLPVEDMGDTSQAMVGYRSVTAQAPEGCTMLPSTGGSRIDEDYRFGCSIESLLAKQISRPADLAGRAGSGDSDGRRQGAVVEGYSAGEANTGLSNAENASE